MPTLLQNTVRSKVTARLAEPHEGELVKSIFTQCFEAPCHWLDWTDVSPHWIIGEVNGEPKGLIMVGLGKPWGWMECLMVHPSLSKVTKGRLFTALERAAYSVLRASGAQGAVCTVSHANPSLHDIVQRKRFVPIGNGQTYLKRLL